MGAYLVPAAVRLGYFKKAQERVLQAPLFGQGLALENDGQKEEAVVSHGEFAVEREAEEGMLVLEDPDEVEVEDKLWLNVFEE